MLCCHDSFPGFRRHDWLQGIYHGVLPGQCPGQGSTCAWVLARPHNWRPQHAQEVLILVDTGSGGALDQRTIPSRSNIFPWADARKCHLTDLFLSTDAARPHLRSDATQILNNQDEQQSHFPRRVTSGNTIQNAFADLRTMLSEKVRGPLLRAPVMAQSLCCACHPWSA